MFIVSIVSSLSDCWKDPKILSLWYSYWKKIQDKKELYHFYWCTNVCFAVLVSMTLCFCLSGYRSLSFFLFSPFFSFCTISYFQSTKIIKNNEVIPQRMAFLCFVRRTDCSLASYSILFFLFFQSVPMMLIAFSAGMNFTLLLPYWDRLCIERCVISFLSLDLLHYLNYLKEWLMLIIQYDNSISCSFRWWLNKFL